MSSAVVEDRSIVTVAMACVRVRRPMNPSVDSPWSGRRERRPASVHCRSATRRAIPGEDRASTMPISPMAFSALSPGPPFELDNCAPVRWCRIFVSMHNLKPAILHLTPGRTIATAPTMNVGMSLAAKGGSQSLFVKVYERLAVHRPALFLSSSLAQQQTSHFRYKISSVTRYAPSYHSLAFSSQPILTFPVLTDNQPDPS